MSRTNTIWFAAIFAVLVASTVSAYPSVTISTPYYEEVEQTTLVHNPFSGDTYINYQVGDYRTNYIIDYSAPRYERRYIRDPTYCQYDWFDRCKDRAYDPDYWYDRCRHFDPRDDEWYERSCDRYFGDDYDGRYSDDRYYKNTYSSGRYVAPVVYVDSSYPRQYVYYVEEKPYTNTVYYGRGW